LKNAIIRRQFSETELLVCTALLSPEPRQGTNSIIKLQKVLRRQTEVDDSISKPFLDIHNNLKTTTCVNV
jgi:hypothetical protein